jgi:hypothetical protein
VGDDAVAVVLWRGTARARRRIELCAGKVCAQKVVKKRNTTFLHALDACVGRWVIAIRRRNGVTQILGKLLPTLIQI